MNIVNISLSLLLFIIGYFIKYKKVTWLISGYNTASKEEKEKYDIDKLCYHMGNFVLLLAFIWSILTIVILLFPAKLTVIMIIGCVIFSLAIISGLIFLNTGGRVKK